MFSSAARHGESLELILLCGKSLHLSWASQGASTVSPGCTLRNFPYRCGLLFLPALHCPFPCANTQSILTETPKQHHLLFFLLLSFLFHLMPGMPEPSPLPFGEQLPGSAGHSPSWLAQAMGREASAGQPFVCSPAIRLC